MIWKGSGVTEKDFSFKPAEVFWFSYILLSRQISVLKESQNAVYFTEDIHMVKDKRLHIVILRL